MNNLMLSACIITYNHENYIRECLEGAVSQIVDFNFEIIIGDDCSNDNTSQVCEEYAKKYPDLIRYYPRKRNLGMIGNWIRSIEDCKGKYIALTEGDDYWTDTNKLQKQVNFLETNLSFIGYCHNFKMIDSNNNTLEESYKKYQNKKYIDTYDIIAGASVATLTVVFRNIFDQHPLPKISEKIGNLDTLIFAWLSTFGNFYAEKNFIAAAYRKHSGGVWSMKPITYIVEQSILTHEEMLAILPAKYAGAVGRKLAAKRAILAVLIYKSNKKEFLEKYCLAVKTCFKYKAFKVFFSLHKKLVFK